MVQIIDIIIILNSIALIFLILLQQRGGSYGSLFGFSGTLPFFQRRGLEKYIYYLTWVLVFTFILLSIIRIYL